MKAQHLKKYLKNAKERAMRKGLEFDLTYEYLESIATTHCPIFGIEFEWGTSNMGKGKTKPNCPSLDRIVPELGYVQGNVAFISHKANRIKDNGTMQDHYDIADWIWEQTYAKQGQPTPIPKKHLRKGESNSQSGAIHGAGVGEDCNGAIHHRGEPQGEDTCDSTQAGCRICMGARGKQVEALELYENCQDYGLTETETRRLAELFGCICHQP